MATTHDPEGDIARPVICGILPILCTSYEDFLLLPEELRPLFKVTLDTTEDLRASDP